MFEQSLDRLPSDGLPSRRVRHYSVLLVERSDACGVASAGAFDEEPSEVLWGMGLVCHIQIFPVAYYDYNSYYYYVLELALMELRQLEYFVAVAEEASFTRAADRVHISQSGVSAQLRQLERELGAPLIDRSSRVASLTPAGAAALEPARSALGAAAEVSRAVDEVNGVIRGRIVSGMVTGCTIAPWFDALAAFRRAHSGVDLILFEDASDRLVEHVRSAGADLALVGMVEPPRDLESRTIIREPLVAAVQPDHPFARRSRISLEAIAEHPVITLPPGTGIRTAFARDCAARGVTAEVALEASTPQAVADLAARGVGVAILSESMVRERGDLVAIGISDARTLAALGFVWRADASSAARRLLEQAAVSFERVAARAKL
jgi:DNA-binding transcriptional LysR family regulator